MPIPARTKQVQRSSLKSTMSGKAPTVLQLVQNPPNNWRWFGDDGHYYSTGKTKSAAINDAIAGNLKRI